MRDLGSLAWLLTAGIVPNLAYLAIGAWMLRGLPVTVRGAERLGLAFVLGSGAASLGILGLRVVDLPVPMLALALVAVSLPIALAGTLGDDPADERMNPAPDSNPGWQRALDASCLGAALLLFLAALGPETSWDGFEYHLPMVMAWAEGPIRTLPAMIDSEFRKVSPPVGVSPRTRTRG